MINYNLFDNDFYSIVQDNKIEMILAMLVVFEPVTNALNAITNLYLPTKLDTLFICVVIVWLTIESWPNLIKRTIKLQLIFLWVVGIICLFSILNNYQNLLLIEQYFRGNPVLILIYLILGYGVYNYEALFKFLKILIPLSVMAGLVQYTILISSKALIIDNMSFAYSFLPTAIITLYFTVKRWNWIFLICSVIAVALLIGSGTRGPLICLIAYIFLYIITNLHSKKVLLTSIVSTIVVLLWAKMGNFLGTLMQVKSLFNNLGVSERIFDFILKNDYFSTQSRDTIFDLTKKAVYENPYIGTGIFGDRVVTGRGYAHNFILEILCQFGIIIGVLVLLVFFFLIIRTYIHEYHLGKDLILIIIPMGLIKLMFSSSYLEEPYFFLLLGICLKNTFNREFLNSKNSYQKRIEPLVIMNNCEIGS